MTAERTFPGRSESVPEARRFVRAELARIGAEGAVDDALCLVSELATNAVLHARTDFTVSVEAHEETVRICVQDGSPSSPRPRSYELDATTGRGMRLVLSLAASWGVDTEAGGKVVWFELPAAATGSGPEAEGEELDLASVLERFAEPEDDGGRAEPVARAA